MAEDTEYKKLPIEERCLHKLWKARVDGYEEAAKIFRELDDDKSPEWMKFMGLIKKMVVDSNAMAQEKGLEAALIFVENCGHAGKTAGDVMSGIVQKCIAAPKTKTKEISVQITLMYIEIEKQESTIDELIKGMEHKNPKIVSACTAAATMALHEFGSKVVSVKPLIKKLAPLMSDRDKGVRDEGKQLAVEIYRWIGAAMKPQIDKLPQVTLKELEDEFEKLKGDKPKPNRYLRSQMRKNMAVAAVAGTDTEQTEDDDGAGDTEESDPMDLLDSVEILTKLPKDFYDKLEEKKWQTRKETIEILEKLLTDSPKLESGDYGQLVHVLKKIITKDSNVILVAMGGKCLGMLAKGLGKRFSPYAMACIPSILEKFKEKKANVVSALRDAMDAIYLATNLEAIYECIVEALSNKNPSVKSETALFLSRAFAVTPPSTINNKFVKLYVAALVKTLNEPDPTVRDSSAEALGVLLKLMGDKIVCPFLLEVDALKMAKIKEFHDKAEIKVKVASGGAKKDRPASAPSAKGPTGSAGGSSKNNSRDPTPVARPATAGGGKKPMTKKSANAGSGIGNGNGSSSNSSGGHSVRGPTGASKALPTEREMTPEEVMGKAEELLPSELLSGLGDSNWKTRLAAVEELLAKIPEFDSKTPGISQILIRTVSGRKPGLKEMNFQVLKIKLDIIRVVADTFPTTPITVDMIINEVTEKLADIKNGIAASDTLMSLTQATRLEYMVGKVLSFALEQKSPKVQSESLNWVNKAILEFGLQLQPKMLIEDVRKAVQSVNPMVRSAAIGLIGTLSMYMGSNLMMFFDAEKPALKSQIQAEFDKCVGEKPPKPIRGIKKTASSSSVSSAGTLAGGAGVGTDAVADDDDDQQEQQMHASDLLPRIDISPQITESLLREMSDKDWKTRNEGLNKLQNIIAEAKLIKPVLGDLPQALALRLVDSNAKIAQSALAICEQLAHAMGPKCNTHIRMLFPGFLTALGDSKTFIRAAALNCINVFGEKGGYKEFFEAEMIADALKTGSPALKCELWGWLAERLPVMPPRSIPKEELTSMLPHLYAHVTDRNADVRKNANEAVLGIMIHLGYETMLKALDKQKPAIKKGLQAALDKARPNLPVKPLPKGKQQAPLPEETKKTIRGGGGGGGGNAAGGGPQKVGAIKAGSSDKTASGNSARNNKNKDEEVDNSPLLAINNAKNQRLIDEQKMRVLRWTFTTPREEFTELLRDQMVTANVNKSLMANMFHDDFRYHLKVIESLSEDLPNNSKGLVCNLDLILKWLSLRFYDTNPSVLLKGLEYLNLVFQKLVDMEYILAENEGNAFIPHLLLKLGDPKDAVRNGVRSLLRHILLVYPFTKVFAHVMEGLKSKNARQRSECLDELGHLIESYGMSVCQPSPSVAMKEIARHISDRDNSVRSAALNCVVQGYFIIGDKIYKLIGNLNEKDLSMLDERIKRAKKVKKVAPGDGPVVNNGVGIAAGAVAGVKVTATVGIVVQQQDSMEIDEPAANGCDELPPPDEQGSMLLSSMSKSTDDLISRLRALKRQATFDQPSGNLYSHLQQQQQQQNQLTRPSGPFGLDMAVIEEIEKDWVRVDQMKLVEVPNVDISLLFDPIKILPTKEGVKYPEEKFQQLIAQTKRYMAMSTTSQATPSSSGNPSPYISPRQQLQQMQDHQHNQYNNTSYGSVNASPNLADFLPKHDPQLVKIIKAISSTDTLKVRAALTELSDIVESPEKQAVLRDYEELFIQNILAQLKNLSQYPLTESLVVYQPIFSILYSFFYSKTLGRTLSVACIKNTMSALLHLMADQKFVNGDEAQYSKVINGICLKILDKTNFTNLNCALIRLLRESCPEAGLPKFTDLLMKCIWRNVKMLPERSNELNYDAVILEVHEFMLALPSSWWQSRPSDTPLRTVKTIIHNMAKVKGNAILQHLNQIPTHSELHSYLIKILKSLPKEENLANVTASPQRGIASKESTGGGGGGGGGAAGRRISNQAAEAMSQIFILISDKDTKQQGLQKLYEFKIQNPDVDVATFFKGASPNFQKHIEDALAEIDRNSGTGGKQIVDNRFDSNNSNQQVTPLSTTTTTTTTGATTTVLTANNFGDNPSTIDPDMWMERLNKLKAKANLNSYNNPNGVINFPDNKVSDENLNLMMNPTGQKSTLIRMEKPDMAPNRLQHIQAKLAQFRKENHT